MNAEHNEITDEMVAQTVREWGGDVETNLHHETVTLIVTAIDAAREAVQAKDAEGARRILRLALDCFDFLFTNGRPSGRGSAPAQWSHILSDVKDGDTLEDVTWGLEGLSEFIEGASATDPDEGQTIAGWTGGPQ